MLLALASPQTVGRLPFTFVLLSDSTCSGSCAQLAGSVPDSPKLLFSNSTASLGMLPFPTGNASKVPVNPASTALSCSKAPIVLHSAGMMRPPPPLSLLFFMQLMSKILSWENRLQVVGSDGPHRLLLEMSSSSRFSN